MQGKKSVLFIAYDFPPAGSRGTKRIVKFIKYLGRLEWEVTVLTVRNPHYETWDFELCREVGESVRIRKARSLERLFFPAENSKEAPPPGRRDRGGAGRRPQNPALRGARRAVSHLYRYLGLYFSIPDSRVLWVPAALRVGYRTIRKSKIDVIVASGPSFTNMIVGAALKMITRARLVVDFRDAWVSDPAAGDPGGLKRAAGRLLERFVIHRSDRIIATTRGLAMDFVLRYGKDAKVRTITNGFDVDDLGYARTGCCSQNGVLRIVHAGTLEAERSAGSFLKALSALALEDERILESIRLIHVGKSGPDMEGKTIEDYARTLGLAGVVELKGYVPRRSSIQLMGDADLLLLIIGDVPQSGAFIYGISGKIFDYALLARPVMTIAREGSSAEIVRELSLGPVYDPDDIEGIKEGLKRALHLHQRRELRPGVDKAKLGAFDFAHLTSELSRELEGVIRDCRQSKEVHDGR